MSLELYLQYGFPTLVLAVALIMYALVRFERWRYDRRSSRAGETKVGPT